SVTIPQLLQVGGDRGIELRSLGLLLAQRRSKPLHLLFERLAIILPRLGTNVAAGREYVGVLAHLLQQRALAVAGDVGVLACIPLAAPCVVGGGDAGDVLIGQLAV